MVEEKVAMEINVRLVRYSVHWLNNHNIKYNVFEKVPLPIFHQLFESANQYFRKLADRRIATSRSEAQLG